VTVAPIDLPQQEYPRLAMVLRRQARKAVRLRVIVAREGGLSTGLISNISERGCELRLREPFLSSPYLTLKVYPEDGTASLQITLAKVKWVGDHRVGAEFLSVAVEHQLRLRRLCEDQVELPLGY
jgi:hypothetical protein